MYFILFEMYFSSWNIFLALLSDKRRTSSRCSTRSTSSSAGSTRKRSRAAPRRTSSLKASWGRSGVRIRRGRRWTRRRWAVRRSKFWTMRRGRPLATTARGKSLAKHRTQPDLSWFWTRATRAAPARAAEPLLATILGRAAWTVAEGPIF